MSKDAITTPAEALAAYRQHLLDIKIFHHGRRRFNDLPWSKALARSRFKSGTDDRLAISRRMRARCKALKAWHAGKPDILSVEDKRVRAGVLLLLKHIELTVAFDGGQHGYMFEYDTTAEHRFTTDTERQLAGSFGLLEAWARGEDVTLLKLEAA